MPLAFNTRLAFNAVGAQYRWRSVPASTDTSIGITNAKGVQCRWRLMPLAPVP
jgi:hypothetical protein